jgi:hypothetical protein
MNMHVKAIPTHRANPLIFVGFTICILLSMTLVAIIGWVR